MHRQRGHQILLRKVGPIPLIVTLLLGCGSAIEGAQASGSEAVARPPSLFSTGPGPDHLTYLPGWNVGIGFVRIRPAPDRPPAEAPPDTLWLLSEPRPDAEPVARVHHREYRLVVETVEAGLEDGALEVGYEERALPLLEGGPDDRWVRVSFARDSTGQSRTGWLEARDPRLERGYWPTWLEQKETLFFLDPDSIEFFTAPDGARIDLPLEPIPGSQRFDYSIYPLSTEGRWMEARVVSPSNHCSEPDSTAVTRAWLRYLSPEGRPRVWYATRGC